jgi:hypothetical protein
MPLLPFQHTPIELPVVDRLPGIKQLARFLRLTHSQASTGECEATITVLITMYAADGADFGPALSGPGFSTYTVDLVADNNCLVDAATGAVLARRKGATESDWQATIDSFEQPTMRQGDFFEYLRDNGLPGTIRQMIEQHITQSDAAPSRFA